jgi:hypothetical protein
MTPVPKLQFQGFSLANEVFRANRDTGVMVYGSALTGHLEYYFGGFNGNGIDQSSNDNPSLLWMARLAGTVMGKPPPAKGHVKYDETATLSGDQPATLQVGLNAYTNRTTTAASGTNPTTSTTVSVGGADFSFTWQRLFWQGEAFFQGTTPDEGTTKLRWGFDTQVGFFVIPSHLELAARASMVRFDVDDPTSWMTQADAQLGWYVAGNHLKALLRYTFTDAGSPQRGYVAGLTHGVVAQLQIWF